MRRDDGLPGYETPFYLFGNARPRAARSLDQLVAAGVFDASTAADLVALAQQGVSLAIIAPGSRVGKSSLLAALLAHLPPTDRRYYLRGCFETFDFAHAPDWRPHEAVMIANEVSDHLPVYLPPRHLDTALQLVEQGARLWCTAHAVDLADLMAAWETWPINAPLAVVRLAAPGPPRIEWQRATLG